MSPFRERFRQPAIAEGLYGQPDQALISTTENAVQLSPLSPGAQSLDTQPDGMFARIVLLAPPGVLERRFVLAQALRILAPDGSLTALAHKDRGGARLFKELSSFGCTVEEAARRHHRICHTIRPANPVGLDAAIAAGRPQIAPALGLWSQPGIFSWDRPDAGSLLLLQHLPPLAGGGADFGCGVGLLARAILESPQVERLSLIDIDRRAIDAARRNVTDPRATFDWRDLRSGAAELSDLDFVVMNPPFHDGGAEDRALGASFIRRAAGALKQDGVCWLVANRHLPYEALMTPLFSRVRQVVQTGLYKIYEARR
jgi:16S rRNA (guanine1207-N2)-methyltransferase